MNKRAIGKRSKSSSWGAYWNFLLYLFAGLLLLKLYRGNAYGPTFVTAASFELLMLAVVTASNILLSFGSGFLAPDELQIISPMPISSETFFASRLVVLLTYSWVITLLFIAGTTIGLPVLYHTSPWLSLSLLVAALASNTAAAMTVVVMYGLVLKKLPKQTLTKAMGYVQLTASLVTATSLVILPRVQQSINFTDWTLAAKPALALLPSFWFGSIAGLALDGNTWFGYLLAGLALVSVIGLAVTSYSLLGKHYTTEVGELAQSTATFAKQAKRKRDGVLFRILLGVTRSFETRAVLMLIRAQFRYDTKFRMSLLATLPLSFIYLLLALFQGGIHDPFTEGWKSGLNAYALYFVALLMPIIVMQTISQTENFKAAWIFFVSPIDRSKLLLAVRNTLLITMILPYMLGLTIVFTFFMPVSHAVPHIIVLSAISGFIFQGFVMIAPRMPFAQQRRPNRGNLGNVMGIPILAGFGALLLGLEMFYAYGDFTRFWLSVALLVTLSVIMEQVVRLRIRRTLAREEFEM